MRKLCTILTALTLVLLCVVLMPAKVQAAEITASGTCGDNLTWTLDDAGTLTISGTGAMSNYLPGMYIPWMDYAESITTIVMKDGVTTIGYGAFSGFTKLTEVTLPASITTIDAQAFANCSGLTQVLYYGTETQWNTVSVGVGNTYLTSALSIYIGSGTCGENLIWTLKNGTLTIYGTGAMSNYGEYSNTAPWHAVASFIQRIVIADGVTSVSKYAFQDCTSLTGVTIPDSITSIGAGAFQDCTSLTSVNIPDSVTCIESWAFARCYSLTSITIPDGVTRIEYATFWFCTSLRNVILSDNVTIIDGSAFQACNLQCNIYGNAKYLGHGNNPYFALVEATSDTITNCQIHPNTKIICGDAFNFCTKLTSVTIPNGVISIGSQAFYYCEKLTSITIPDSVTSLGNYVFVGCKYLSSISLSENLTSISNELFKECKRLTSITIPDSVTSVGDGAFSNCESLTSVIIPDSVTSIGASAFYNCNCLTSITIPDSVTSIGASAFYNCNCLTSITIPDSVTRIGAYAFYNCNLIYNIYGNAKYLGNQNNPYLVLVEATEFDIVECTIHPNTKIILAEAFYFCTRLSKVYISDLTAWCQISFDVYVAVDSMGEFIEFYNNPLYYAENLYINGKLTTELIIPDGVTIINDYAFVGCPNLSIVGIPTSVTSIGEDAFDGCNGIENVVYCGTDEQWNKMAISSGNANLTGATRSAHSWSATITKVPTYTATGINTLTCVYCGEQKTGTIPAKFYGTSVNLGNTLDMYFGFYTGLVDEGGTVKFVREYADGTTETTTAPITSFKKNNSVYDITYTGLAAKEMCDTIHIYVYNGDGELVGEHADSIRSYILRQLREKDYGQEFRTLCVDLLNYGAAAQSTFGYNATDLANKDLTAEELAEGTQTVANYVDKQSIDGTAAAYYGTAYILETKISMNMAVRGSYFGDGCYALVSYTDHTGTEKKNIRLEGKKNNSVYEFTLDEIVVADGRCLLTIEFYKADGTKVVTVQDSMEGYTARNAQYYPLAEKMLAFSDSAYAYLH